MKKNIYIVADGLGGTGKATVLKDLGVRLGQKGYRVVMTYEPGGTPEADALRNELFARKAAGKITPREELEYVFAARAINMKDIVIPALACSEQTVILKGRDYMSSFIYQVASGADRDLLLEFYRREYEAVGFPRPDLRLLMILDPKTAMRRRMGAGANGDGFDLQPDDYWNKVAIGYYCEALDIARGKGLFRRETVVIDASPGIEKVCTEVWGKVAWRFGLEEIEEEGRRPGWRK